MLAAKGCTFPQTAGLASAGNRFASVGDRIFRIPAARYTWRDTCPFQRHFGGATLPFIAAGTANLCPALFIAFVLAGGDGSRGYPGWTPRGALCTALWP